jgi:hypothetical protein
MLLRLDAAAGMAADLDWAAGFATPPLSARNDCYRKLTPRKGIRAIGIPHGRRHRGG